MDRGCDKSHPRSAGTCGAERNAQAELGNREGFRNDLTPKLRETDRKVSQKVRGGEDSPRDSESPTFKTVTCTVSL